MDKMLFNIIRLKIMSTLISVDTCDFNYLLKITESTKGNLSIQLKKLGGEKYINVNKCFENNYPKTRYKITSKGVRLFEKFFKDIQTLKKN
tara:strand:- start:1414 stop:1686 length:273 start_codon:yes stop_codon:yes gene_type:complete